MWRRSPTSCSTPSCRRARATSSSCTPFRSRRSSSVSCSASGPRIVSDFRRWSLVAVDALTGGDVDAYEKAKHAIADCIEVEVDARLARRATPGDDVSSLLAVAPCATACISRAEMRHLGYQLLVAGHETTTSLIGLMLYRLIEHPDADGPTARRPGARAPCRRGSTAVRLAGPGVVPHERVRVHDRRSDARPAEQAAAAVRFGEQGSASSSRTPMSSASTGRQRAAPPRRLRVGHPLLHRCPARPTGGTAHVRAHPRPDGRHRAGGSSATQRLVRAPRV